MIVPAIEAPELALAQIENVVAFAEAWRPVSRQIAVYVAPWRPSLFRTLCLRLHDAGVTRIIPFLKLDGLLTRSLDHAAGWRRLCDEAAQFAHPLIDEIGLDGESLMNRVGSWSQWNIEPADYDWNVIELGLTALAQTLRSAGLAQQAESTYAPRVRAWWYPLDWGTPSAARLSTRLIQALRYSPPGPAAGPHAGWRSVGAVELERARPQHWGPVELRAKDNGYFAAGAATLVAQSYHLCLGEFGGRTWWPIDQIARPLAILEQQSAVSWLYCPAERGVEYGRQHAQRIADELAALLAPPSDEPTE